MEIHFPHKSIGIMRIDPRHGTKYFKPWWALLECDEGIIAYYNWFLKKCGEEVMFNKLWGPHISVVKGNEPQNKKLWSQLEGIRVNFWYSNVIRMDNQKHAWLDVFSPELAEILRKLGTLEKIFFHITIGRSKWM